MKKVNATFFVESDLAEYKLRNVLEGLDAKYVKTIPLTDHLKENITFKKLTKAKKSAELELYRFINNNREII